MLSLIADATVGGYFSPMKIVLMLVLAVPWVLVAPWLQRDAKIIRAPEPAWSAGFLGVGAIAFLVWLFMPVYVLGLVAYVVLVGATFGAYVVYRNSHCDDASQLLTGNFFHSLIGKAQAKSIEVVELIKLYDCRGRLVAPPAADTASQEEKLTYNTAQRLLYDLTCHRASEADVTPSDQQGIVRMVVDGVVADREPLELTRSEAVIQYLKIHAGMDVDDRRRPQKGNISLDGPSKRMDVVLATAGTTGGQRAQFRMVQEVVRTELGELGISENVLANLTAANSSKTGLLIVSSPARNGVTSTLYSLLREHDAFIQQLVTLESKPVVDMENITQNVYDSDEDLPHKLATTVRRDPDVILVDRCPNAETAEAIVRASQSKLVLLGMRAPDSFVALAKWVKVCGDRGSAMASLRGISCQILMRKLCMECREAYSPDPQMLAKVNISGKDIRSFYRKPTGPRTDEKGNPIVCPVCQESGYFGRTGIFEYLEITDQMRKLIVSGADVRQIKAAGRKNKMLNLQEQALRKVIEGVTSIKEVIRVSQKSKKK